MKNKAAKQVIKNDSRMAAFYMKRGIVRFAVRLFLAILIAGICFTILYPLIDLVPTIFSSFSDLGNPNVIWIPKKPSIVSLRAGMRYLMPAGLQSLLRSVGYAAGIMVLQVFFSAMVGYSLARVRSWINKVVMLLVILSFLVPRQSLLLAQFIALRHFDLFGLMKLFTDAGEVNLINNPVVLVLIAIFCFGVNQSLMIFIFSQFFKNIPKELEEAALIDGCGFYKTYFRIMIPNAVPVISTIGILSFVWNYTDTYFTNYFNPKGNYMSTLLSSTFIPANKETVLNALRVWYDEPVVTDLAFDAVKQASTLIFLLPLLAVFLIGQRKLVENLENSGLVG